VLKKIWDFEITPEQAATFTWLPVVIVILSAGYICMELLFLPSLPEFLTLSEFKNYLKQNSAEENNTVLIFFIALLIITFFTRQFVSVYGYFIKSKITNRALAYRSFMVYTTSGIIGVASGLALLLAGGLIYLALGYSFKDGAVLITSAETYLAAGISNYIPTLFVIHSKIIALLLTLTIYSFTSYFIHWLTHVSRFLWHVAHGPHHLPDFLHPIGNPLAFTFDIFLLLPKVLSMAVISKLFYSEPLILEMGIYSLLMYNFEIFNHATVHYTFIRKYAVLRFFTQFFGGHGAYHYVHHSSAKEHQMANIGGGMFLMWDRIFGTFVEPPVQPPAIGWTNNPAIYMNPLRVIFGGPARIIYELRMNKDWKTRFLILFGPINYEPAISINYIKK
jgi:sterol desaturase/sphingolipid hydroxylase (fatty acid hydroxylase superfamily)